MLRISEIGGPRIGPTSVVLIVAFALVATIGLLRPAEGDVQTGLTRDEFWRLKLEAAADFDVVLLGDSRVLCDLSPAAMHDVLNLRTLNFGFNFVGFTQDYLQAAEEKLDHASRRRMLVIGITPRAFTPLNARMSAFREEKERNAFDAFTNRWLSDLNAALRPAMPSSIIWYFRGIRTNKNFYRDGLMSVEIIPPDPNQDLRTYLSIFRGNAVSPKTTELLLAQIARWRVEGIEVYVFRPPTSPEILQAEEAFSGFDEQAFRTALQAAGGIWIDVPLGKYTLADGSHVSAKQVPEFSRAVARSILKSHDSTGVSTSQPAQGN